MSPRQYKKYFEKLGFTDVCPIPEVWKTVEDEVEVILKQHGLTFLHPKKLVWESPNFLDVKSNTEYCVETFAEKRIIVFQALHEEFPAAFTARIDHLKLANLVEKRTFYANVYLYWPGHAVLIYASESRYYDQVSPICAKVFKGRVKSQLLGESDDPLIWVAQNVPNQGWPV